MESIRSKECEDGADGRDDGARLRADYHWHPNMLRGLAQKPRVKRSWDALTAAELDAVIATDHARMYHPADGYRRIADAMPASARTHVYPGLELATNDGMKGIEVVAFAEDDWYDDHPDLLKPHKMTLEEIIAYLHRAEDLHYFIPHPYLLFTALRRRYPSVPEMRRFLSTIRAYEVSNGCYDQILALLNNVPYCDSVRDSLLTSARPTSGHLPEEHEPRFLAAGSDAHHPEDLGQVYVDIPVTHPAASLRRSQVFQVLTSNTDMSGLSSRKETTSLVSLARTAPTMLREGFLKQYRRVALSAGLL